MVISRIEMVAKRTVVHNFEVEDYHTYYVSGQEFLVHNNGCPTLNGGNTISEGELKYGPDKRGNAPIGNDGHPVEVHHADQKLGNSGRLDEMTRTNHRLGENFKKNHVNTGGEASTVNRGKFNTIKKNHFKSQFDKGTYKNLPTKPK